MGVEPLPADLRFLCDCTGGCNLAWEGPQKRMWATWPDADGMIYPNLAAGILMELVEASISVQNCEWRPVTAFAPFVLLVVQRTGQSPFTGTGGAWIIQGADVFLSVYLGQGVFTPDPCEDFKTLASATDTFTPKIDSGVNLEPVRWWENADDVPH